MNVPRLRLCRRAPSRQLGFTLIELMITVAIIGILARIAYPAYIGSVTKSRRVDAKTALMDLAQREERYMSTANQYSTSAPALGYASGTTITTAAPMPVVSGATAYYNLSVQVPNPLAPSGSTAPSFLATATAIGSQANDTKCGNFTVDNTGAQAVTGTSAATSCW